MPKSKTRKGHKNRVKNRKEQTTSLRNSNKAKMEKIIAELKEQMKNKNAFKNENEEE